MELTKRREELTNWIIERWGIEGNFEEISDEIMEEEEEISFDDVD